MIIKETYLVTLTSKNQIQTSHLRLDQNEDGIFHILRTTGLLNCKQINHPVITIEKGKVKRTPLEQSELQYNSLLKNYLDKGYIQIDNFDLSEEEIRSKLGNTVTNQFGVPKPMLAILAEKCKPSIWEKAHFVSRKLNGVRCGLYYKDGEVKTSSRGGGNYDKTTTHIRCNPKIIALFQNNPNLILDGEIYHHRWSLQKISGLARLKEYNSECEGLEYWVYDMVDTKPFSERWQQLCDMEPQFLDTPIKLLEQKLMTGYDNIKAEHDRYVQEGFEGLCARNPDKEYGVDKRSGDYLIKLKVRKDAEALIVDVKEGLRPEDMCFILQMPNGITFAAKPTGTVETRLEYLQNKDSYIGKQMTYTYFDLSEDGVPEQPVAQHVRPDDE